MVCTTLNLQLSIIINGKILAYKTRYYVQNIKSFFLWRLEFYQTGNIPRKKGFNRNYKIYEIHWCHVDILQPVLDLTGEMIRTKIYWSNIK